jgi:hypothetical protein
MMLLPSSQISQVIATRRIRLSPFQDNQRHSPTATATALSSSPSDDQKSEKIGEDDMEEEDAWYENLDVLGVLDDGDELYGNDTKDDWTPDAEKAKGRRPRDSRDLIPAKEVLGDSFSDDKKNSNGGEEDPKKKRPSPYTEEEEELIENMGGKVKKEKASTREIGYLGDSTLRDISRDYSVPICYLADVLAMWGVPVPINVHDRLGDLVTGEQAFALVEAVNTLDMGYLNDRYSNQNMLQVCDGWEIDISDAFQFAMKEGWSLPFGVRTNLRCEQEDELLRVFSTMYSDVDED